MEKKLLGELELNRIYQRDCIEGMRLIPDDSVNLIVIDPPYNIGKDSRWDKWKSVEGYVDFMSTVFKECERVLKPNGSFYFFHNDMVQVRKLMDAIDDETSFVYKNFILWNKRYNGSPRKYYFDNVIKTESSRSYRPLTEYCLFYTFQKELTDVTHDVNKFESLRSYFREFLAALGITKKALMENVGQRADHCFRCSSSQWDLPTQETYESLLELPRDNSFVAVSYAELTGIYEGMRQQYESERYTYNHQKTHHDVWDYEVAPKLGHCTPKPLDLIENIILHSSNPGDVVLDCFMGSGTTAVASARTGRNFIGFEREPEYVEITNKRLDNELEAN
ncbi:DNA-methyltransferase [Mesobacillus zeae]|uniref:Methyltransferase n=1 Tax=Mesobacillus zeae TaxID=1917180 RepID=A0A398BH83_9BACI|nr:site-specific DNA-methyltransferase [Mesobacillus zeae]RID88964.1 site-specific DNA-methyltransferase [Mesobacillus zeae]